MTTTATLEAPLAGTGEQRGPSAEKPEPVYPACKKLKAALSDYSSAEAELETYRGKEAKAELAMSEALEDGELTEQEAAQKISHARDLKAVYAGRAAKLEKKAAGLLTELGAVLVAAVSELTHVVVTELERQREIMVDRFIAVLGGVDDHALGSDKELFRITRFSKPLNALELLKPSPLYNVKDMPAADIVRSAQSVLKALETFKLEVRK